MDEERATLEELVNKGKNPAYKVNHARILLLADRNRSGGGWSARDISQTLKISVATIERVRQRQDEQGLSAALSRKQPQNRRQRRKGWKTRSPSSLPSPVARLQTGKDVGH